MGVEGLRRLVEEWTAAWVICLELSTGGLVDPMKTKLEMMVAYLAGRKGEAAESIRRELEDPTSEASRCLEALRSRSRGVFGAELPEMPGPIPAPQSATGDRTRDARETAACPLLFGASSAALVFIAVGVAWRAQDDRLRHLEAILARREARWGDRFNRLEAALTETGGTFATADR